MKTFKYQNKTFNYFSHPHNNTALNERAIEIPIIMGEIRESASKNILEIGNVLSHYFLPEWTILDKYEKAKGVINEDIFEFFPDEKYDLIVSISTFEHIGFDEYGRYGKKKIARVKEKIRKLIHHIFMSISSNRSSDFDEYSRNGQKKSTRAKEKINEILEHINENCLNKNGECIFTVPLGFNLGLDKQIFMNTLNLNEVYFLKRLSYDNKWGQCPKEDILNTKYGEPFPWANAIAIGILRKN